MEEKWECHVGTIDEGKWLRINDKQSKCSGKRVGGQTKTADKRIFSSVELLFCVIRNRKVEKDVNIAIKHTEDLILLLLNNGVYRYTLKCVLKFLNINQIKMNVMQSTPRIGDFRKMD